MSLKLREKRIREEEKEDKFVDHSTRRHGIDNDNDNDVFAAYTYIPVDCKESKFLPRLSECENWRKELEKYNEIINILRRRIGNIDGIVGMNGIILSYDRITCWQNISVLNQIGYNAKLDYNDEPSWDWLDRHNIEEIYFENEIVTIKWYGIFEVGCDRAISSIKGRSVKSNEKEYDSSDLFDEVIMKKILFFDCNSIRIDFDVGDDCGVISKYRHIDHKPLTIKEFLHLTTKLTYALSNFDHGSRSMITINDITISDNNDVAATIVTN